MDRGTLTLSRRVGEKIVIGNGPDAIVIEVVRCGERVAKLAIDAPRVVPVRREEIAERTS